MNEGIFLLSLDFELAWGISGDIAREAYRENLLGVWLVLPALLELFKKYEIHATWATVGFLHCRTKEELLQYFPSQIPQYANHELSNYKQFGNLGNDEETDPLHYASSLVQLIRNYPFQELGSHTFSHYYCLEEGQSAAAFTADLDAAKKIALDKYGEFPKSLVFPRNQVNEEYLQLCRKFGVVSYRGNPRFSVNSSFKNKLGQWIYNPTPGTVTGAASFAVRFLRLLDGYFPITGHHTYTLNEIANQQTLFDIPASSFLQSYRKPLKFFEPVRLNKIKSGLTHAAKHNAIYHLWFHPHQFGKNPEINMSFLEEILDHYCQLKKIYNFSSLNMGELSNILLNLKDKDERECDLFAPKTLIAN